MTLSPNQLKTISNLLVSALEQPKPNLDHMAAYELLLLVRAEIRSQSMPVFERVEFEPAQIKP